MNPSQVPTFQNKDLEESVHKIIAYSRNIIVNHFQIAYELLIIKNLESYKEDGYESVTEFAEKILGFSKTSTSMAIKVAERYLINEGTRVTTTFSGSDEDFSFNQLRETLPLSIVEVNRLLLDKRLNSSMTLKQIRSVVQEEKNRRINESFGAETEENRGINSRVIDVTATSIVSSAQGEQELETEESETNLSDNSSSIESTNETIVSSSSLSAVDSSVSESIESFSLSETLLTEIPAQSHQNAPEALSDSSLVSDYHRRTVNPTELLSRAIIDNYINGEEEEDYPLTPYEYRFYNYHKEQSETKRLEDIEIDELVDIRLPKELRECFELMKKEIKRLNYFKRIESARLGE